MTAQKWNLSIDTINPQNPANFYILISEAFKNQKFKFEREQIYVFEFRHFRCFEEYI